MINNPDYTSRTEIIIIGKAFNISIKKIEALLGQASDSKKMRKKTAASDKSPMKKERETDKFENRQDSLDFSDFEEVYVNAKDQSEELAAIKKYLPACSEAKDPKLLYELCPEDEESLKNEIIFRWVELSKNLTDIREVKPLTKKGTPAGNLAYRKYLDFF